jgi:hypothetical protein
MSAWSKEHNISQSHSAVVLHEEKVSLGMESSLLTFQLFLSKASLD